MTRVVVTVQFSCISAALNVLQLLPVTSAEVERVHSAFKFIKTKMMEHNRRRPSKCPSLSYSIITKTSHLHMRQSLTCMPDATPEGSSS